MSFSSRIKSTKTIRKEEVHKSHSTKILMNLKDPAIKITNSLTENKTYKGHLSHFIYGTLTFTPKLYPLCKTVTKDYSIVKNGAKECTIKWLPLTHTPTYFVLKKQRFLCRNCSHTFITKSTEIEENYFISNLTKQSIAVATHEFYLQGSQTHEILDILPNRQFHALRSYFSQFPLSVRKQVQSVVLDMNAPYFIAIQDLFPNQKRSLTDSILFN